MVRFFRLFYPAPWILSTRSPKFSNLLKYNGFGHLCEGLVKIGLLGAKGSALAKASLGRLAFQFAPRCPQIRKASIVLFSVHIPRAQSGS
jgi:hypothetical protein